MRLNLTLLTILLISSCSLKKIVYPTDIKSTLEITSSPSKAKVYHFSVKQNEVILIGNTPLKVSFKDLIEENNLKSIKLTVAKNGFIKEHIIINNNLSNQKIQIKLEEAYRWAKKGQKETSYALNGSWKDLQKINRFVRSKKYSESLVLIDEMIKDFEYAAILYDMKGSILTLLNRKDEAKAYYLKAKRLREKE